MANGRRTTPAQKRGAALRSVKPGERAPQAKAPKNVEEAAASSDPLDLLLLMSARIAKAIDDPNTPARDLAALTRRMHELAKDIAAIRAARENDEIADAADTPDEAFDGSL